MNTEMLAGFLSAYHKGADNAISGPDLARYFHLKNTVELRAWVNEARLEGDKPICASPAEGYYWPRCPEDTEHTLSYLYDMANSFMGTALAIEAGRDKLFIGKQSQLF